MQYRFLDPGDERLIATSELPTEGGIAVALRTTGYDADEDEILELAIVDFAGNELFSQVVKPQNVEDWEHGDATGGIAPADVEGLPELYQSEQEISDLFENASIVVGQHMPFIENMFEQSWVTLPDFTGFDLLEEFRTSHCTADYRTEPAAIAALSGIAQYYGYDADESTALSTAQAVATGYLAIVAEHAQEREAKGEAYWARRDEQLAEEKARDEGANRVAQLREKRFNQMNALLWVAGGLIFVSLIIQLVQREGDISLMVASGAAAIFCFIRAIINFRR